MRRGREGGRKMQGVLPMQKKAASPKEQTALDRYIQQWQIADTICNGMEQMMEELARQMEQSSKSPRKRR